MTDVTLWLERSPGQDRELRTAEVLRSRVSVRCVPLHPLLPALSDGINYIDYGVLCCYQDVENALHVSNTARKDTGDDKLVGRLHPPILSPCFHFIRMCHVSSVFVGRYTYSTT
jgi:hypothetical protein